MVNMNIIVSGGNVTQEEIEAYIDRAREKFPEKQLTGIEIAVDGDFVDLTYHWNAVSYEHIKRIK